jgi:hypothetical protein
MVSSYGGQSCYRPLGLFVAVVAVVRVCIAAAAHLERHAVDHADDQR